MAEDLKKETVKGVAWSGIDKLANGGIQFIANIVLARLLTPNDFGLLAIIAIFIQISQTFVDSGFGNALIQKKDRSQTDYSTVFFFNLAISIGFYIILFFCAPWIANFFKNEHLTALTRVVGLNLIIGALVSVHKTKLSIELRFKIQSIISLVSSILSSAIAICLAYKGWGVWSLVVLTFANIFLQTIFFYVFINWRPSLKFSTSSFKRLFGYSSKLLGASLIHLLYRNLYPIVIGKKFSAVQLGYFNRADMFAMYPSSTVSSVVSRVAFPIFSRIQDDNDKLRGAYIKYIVFSSLLIFPMMACLIVLAKPLTSVLLTDKWLPMVSILQILCIDWMTDNLCQINLNILFVKGRSDLALRLEIIKKTTAIIILFVSLYWGIIGVCWGRVLYGFIAVLMNSFYTKRLINLNLLEQFRILIKPIIYTLIMSLIVGIVTHFSSNSLVNVFIGVSVGIFVYMIILAVVPDSPLKEIKRIIT